MVTKKKIILVTCEGKAAGSVDDEFLRQALTAQSIAFETRVWSDQAVNWSDATAVVIRTTWDYQRNLPSYLAWVDKVGGQTKLYNPAPVIRWNSSKHYLHDLEARGLPIVPTRIFNRLDHLMAELGNLHQTWSRLIMKPAVSASAELTYLFDHKDDVEEIARKILARGDLLIQPFIESIGTEGEVSLVYFSNGEGYRFSHAVAKSPASGDFRVQADFGGSATPFTPSLELVELGMQTLAALPAQVLFARIDLLAWHTKPLIGEIELIEPELFFRCDSNSAGLFVQGLVSTLNRDSWIH